MVAYDEIVRGNPNNLAGAIAPLPPIRGSVRIRRYERGIATWAESMAGWSSATAPLEATVLHDDGRIEYLASNDGSRARVRMGAEVEVGEGRLITDGTAMSLYEHKADRWISVKLPRGDLLWDIRWDGHGALLVSESAPDTDRDPVHPPSDSGELPAGWPARGPLPDVMDERLRRIALRAQQGVTHKDQATALREIRWAAEKGIQGDWP